MKREKRDFEHWPADARVCNAQLQARCEAQAEEIGRQAEELATLRALVEELRETIRQNSSNSSKPPSSDSPSQRLKNREKRRRKGAGRKRGGQPGHKGHSRKLIRQEDVDFIEPHYPAECENCWQPLPEVDCVDPIRHQVTELTGKGGMKVTEYQCHGVACPGCGHVTWATGDQTSPLRRLVLDCAVRLSCLPAFFT